MDIYILPHPSSLTHTAGNQRKIPQLIPVNSAETTAEVARLSPAIVSQAEGAQMKSILRRLCEGAADKSECARGPRGPRI